MFFGAAVALLVFALLRFAQWLILPAGKQASSKSAWGVEALEPRVDA
jgi:hypothetical protein